VAFYIAISYNTDLLTYLLTLPLRDRSPRPVCLNTRQTSPVAATGYCNLLHR